MLSNCDTQPSGSVRVSGLVSYGGGADILSCVVAKKKETVERTAKAWKRLNIQAILHRITQYFAGSA